MTKPILTVLRSGSVIDRSVLLASTVAEIQTMIDTLPERGVLVVPSADKFFTSANMIKLIEDGDTNYKLVAEQASVTISDVEVRYIQEAVKLRDKYVKEMGPKLLPYSFQDTPDMFNLDTEFPIGSASSTRSRFGNMRPSSGR